MKTPTYNRNKLVAFLEKRKVATKDELIEHIGCSSMTLHRLLKQIGYYTSYNFNASYYTLEHVARFDSNGLWCYKKVCFSQKGTLTETLLAFIENSDAGLTSRELAILVGDNVLPLLTNLFKANRISREKIGTSYIYFHSEQPMQQCQIERRNRQYEKECESALLPSPPLIIAVLVELIKHPHRSISHLSRTMKRKGLSLTRQQIETIFQYYKLPQKKT